MVETTENSHGEFTPLPTEEELAVPVHETQKPAAGASKLSVQHAAVEREASKPQVEFCA